MHRVLTRRLQRLPSVGRRFVDALSRSARNLSSSLVKSFSKAKCARERNSGIQRDSAAIDKLATVDLASEWKNDSKAGTPGESAKERVENSIESSARKDDTAFTANKHDQIVYVITVDGEIHYVGRTNDIVRRAGEHKQNGKIRLIKEQKPDADCRIYVFESRMANKFDAMQMEQFLIDEFKTHRMYGLGGLNDMRASKAKTEVAKGVITAFLHKHSIRMLHSPQIRHESIIGLVKGAERFDANASKPEEPAKERHQSISCSTALTRHDDAATDEDKKKGRANRVNEDATTDEDQEKAKANRGNHDTAADKDGENATANQGDEKSIGKEEMNEATANQFYEPAKVRNTI